MPLRASNCTPAASSPIPSTSGPRPTATSIRSHSTVSPSPNHTVSAFPRCSTWVHCLPSCSVMPRLPNAFASSFAASASSCGISVSSISITVTSEPNRLKIDANSQPMMPPPRMTSRRGTSVWASRPVESTHRSDSRPGIGGRSGNEPVAITADLKRRPRRPHRDRVRVGEAAAALHPLDAVRLEQACDALSHLPDDAGLPLVRSREVEPRLLDADAERAEHVVRLVQELGRLDPRLRRDAADAKARAAELGLLLDAGHARAELRGADRGRVSAGPPPRTATSTSISLSSIPLGDAGDASAPLRHEDELAELPARRERVVGGLDSSSGNVRSTGTLTGRPRRAENVTADPLHDECLLLEPAGRNIEP